MLKHSPYGDYYARTRNLPSGMVHDDYLQYVREKMYVVLNPDEASVAIDNHGDTTFPIAGGIGLVLSTATIVPNSRQGEKEGESQRLLQDSNAPEKGCWKTVHDLGNEVFDRVHCRDDPNREVYLLELRKLNFELVTAIDELTYTREQIIEHELADASTVGPNDPI